MANQSEQVLLRLRELIMEGYFPPGSHVMEIPVAEQLNVSRTPVRWALGALAQEGLLDYKPKRGFIVRGYSIKEIIDAVEARGCVEALACGILAAQGVNDGIALQFRSNLLATEALAMMSKLDASATDRWCELNDEFHSLIVRECGNATLARFSSQVASIPFASPRTLAATTSNLNVRIPLVIKRGFAMHEMIFEAIMAKNSRRAETLMREHVSQGAENLKAALDNVSKIRSVSSSLPSDSKSNGGGPEKRRRKRTTIRGPTEST